MKKLLPLIVFFATLFMYNFVAAQCTVSDLKVRFTNINTNTCEVTFDLSWTQEVNAGNKFAYIHMWTASGYHTPAANWNHMYNNPTAYPVSADLVNTLSTIVINDNASNLPSIGTVYHPDPAYILPQLTGLSIVKVHLNNTAIERMTVQNIKLTLPSCVGAQTIKFDVWASQAANGKNVHCATEGAQVVINEIRPFGLIYCTNPTQFQVFIQNSGPALNNVTYKVFLDYAPQAIINPTDTLVFTSGNITLPANGTYTSAITGYLPYSGINPSASRPLIMEVSIPCRPNTIVATIENSCGPLPVSFTSFTAKQLTDKVLLNWQTANEQNNRGFEIQRKRTGGSFETIAFVPTQAKAGNSNVLLNYQFYDMDNVKGTGLYYRIKQLDMDGYSNFSEIRYIKKEGSALELMIYPNPSKGMVNIILPVTTSTVDMLLKDMAGKVIKRWNGINSDHLVLTDLKAGIYVLNVFVRETGEMKLNKIIVQ